jgi:DNA-directed RNA polymerase subunit RPC12/RpoP
MTAEDLTTGRRGTMKMPEEVVWTCATCGRELIDPEGCTWEEWYSETCCERCSTERTDKGGEA